MSEMVERSWDVGLLNKPSFRAHLQELRYRGLVQDWYEKSFFWSSIFVVRATLYGQSDISGWCQVRSS